MRRLALLFLVSLPAFALAQVRPQTGEGDPRLQTIVYNPQQVVQLEVASGYQLMVSLAPSEVIETIGVGDSAAWQVTPGKRGDFFFVKNVQATSPTNLTVVTDARTYSFELSPGGGYQGASAYTVRFLYETAEAKADADEAEAKIESGLYRVRGAKVIRPSAVMHYGNQVFIEWLPNQPMPAVFKREDREEALVNGEMQNGRFVIAGVPQHLVFRLGKKMAIATLPRKQRASQ